MTTGISIASVANFARRSSWHEPSSFSFDCHAECKRHVSGPDAQEAKVEELTAELIQLSRQLKANLKVHHDFRQARLEQRLESGGCCMNELAPADIIGEPNGPHPNSNWYTRSYYGGHEEGWEIGYFPGTCYSYGLKELILLPEFYEQFTENAIGAGLCFAPGGMIPAHPRFLNPVYVKRRIERALNFACEHSFSEVCGRLAKGWERRVGRAYPREDPPRSTPNAPSIYRHMHQLIHNGNMHRPGCNDPTLVHLYKREEGEKYIEHSVWGQKKLKDGSYYRL